MKNVAIILAGGKGERFGSSLPKQFIKLAGQRVIEHTLDIFEKNDLIDEIYIVSNPNYTHTIEEIVVNKKYGKVTKIINGGKDRRESSYLGINAINHKEAKVLIHDAVRPLLSPKTILDSLKALDTYKAIDVAIPASDTIIEIKDGILEDIPVRSNMWQGQTPQGFLLSVIKKAHELANKESELEVTDDCSLVLKYNLAPIKIVEGEKQNMKITAPLDIYIADKYFQLKSSTLAYSNYSPEKLKDKVVVVFGGSEGIGKSIIDIAKSMGAKTHSFSRKENKVDISNFNDVELALEQVYKEDGKIDSIINTAAILKIGNISERDVSDIANEVNINYMGVINISKASFKYLKESKGHLTLFTSSSYTRGRALYSTYSSIKSAIVNFAQAVSEEWMPEEIKVNAICPDRTATPMRVSNFGKEAEGTLLTADEVALKTLSVIESKSTGQVFEVKMETV